MKERGILFKGELVRAILAGTKTQTRRLVKPQPVLECGAWYWHSPRYDNGDGVHYFHTEQIGNALYRAWTRACPYGAPGDRLWVRETWATTQDYDGLPPTQSGFYDRDPIWYAAELGDTRPGRGRWRPSIHMPRWASRITLEITDVRVQRLQEITPDEVAAEGIGTRCDVKGCTCWRDNFRESWDRINGRRADWLSNPWVWALTFKRIVR